MTRGFFDPTPEKQILVLIDAAPLRKAEQVIEFCNPGTLLFAVATANTRYVNRARGFRLFSVDWQLDQTGQSPVQVKP